MKNRIAFVAWLAVFAHCHLCVCLASPLPVYSITLNSDQTTPQSVSAADVQTVCIYVNGNPIGVFPNEKSIAASLNQFLRPGTNEIRVADSAKRQWELVLIRADQVNPPASLLETNLTAAGGEFAVSINLTNVSWSLPIFASEISDRDVSKASVLTFLQRVFASFSDKDKSSVVGLLQNDGLAIWQPRAYGVTDEVVATRRTETERNMASIESVVESPKEDTLKILKGKNAILVYSGFVLKDGRANACLGKLRLKDGVDRVVFPLVLYRKDGAWAIWQ
jgi:hypothetical protein